MNDKRLASLKELDEVHMSIKHFGLTSEQFPGYWQYVLSANERSLLLDLIDKARDEVKYPSFWSRIKERFTI